MLLLFLQTNSKNNFLPFDKFHTNKSAAHTAKPFILKLTKNTQLSQFSGIYELKWENVYGGLKESHFKAIIQLKSNKNVIVVQLAGYSLDQ